MNRGKELALTIIDAWENDKIKGKFWHDIVYRQCYPILHAPDPDPDPVAWLAYHAASGSFEVSVPNAKEDYGFGAAFPVYTSPPARKPLSEQERRQLFFDKTGRTATTHWDYYHCFCIGLAHGIE